MNHVNVKSNVSFFILFILKVLQLQCTPSLLCLSLQHKPLIISTLINMNKQQQKSLLPLPSPPKCWELSEVITVGGSEQAELCWFLHLQCQGQSAGSETFPPAGLGAVMLSTSGAGRNLRPNALLRYNFLFIYIASLVVCFALILPLCQIRHC